MFSNSYQSGIQIELYNPQNKDLIKNWKFSGKIVKEYDNLIKGYVNVLNAGGVSKMQIPQNDKQSLGIVQSYIVFQLYLFSLKSFNIEIGISDTSKTKRRLIYSASSKDLVINPLHSRIPMLNIPIGTWINLSIDVLSFVSECFKSQSFRSIDFISITANCKIRRIFSMRNSLIEFDKNPDEDFQIEYGDILPKNLTLPSNIQQENINFNLEKLKTLLEANDLKISKEPNSNNLSCLNVGGVPSPYQKKINGEVRNNFQKKHQTTKTQKIVGNGTNIRSKSQNRPLKTNNGEIFNNQEYDNNFRLGYDSKSPEWQKENIDPEEGNNEIENYNKITSPNNNRKNKTNNYNNYNTNQRNLNANKIKNIKQSNNKNKSDSNSAFVSQSFGKNSNLSNKNPKIANKGSKPNSKFNLEINTNIISDDTDKDNGKKTEIINKEEKSNILLNTLNYKNLEKWDHNKDNGSDSIEEIFEIGIPENLKDGDVEDNRNQNHVYDEDKNKIDDSEEDKFYYDIPIKDSKKKTHYKESGNSFNKITRENYNSPDRFRDYKEKDIFEFENSKKKMIEEIWKDSHNTLAMIDKERPFTPPFTKLVPINSIKSLDKANIIIERAKEEIMNSDLYVFREKENELNNVKMTDSLEISQNVKSNDNDYLDLIYDHVLGCYYDPKTNTYYELKN